VVVLSTIGFVLITAVLAGFVVIHRRLSVVHDGSFPQSTRETIRLPRRRDGASFGGEHEKADKSRICF
jgi:hypothetical protein